MIQCQAPDCKVLFQPKCWNAKYHAPACKRRVFVSTHKQLVNDFQAAYRAKHRVEARAYREKHWAANRLRILAENKRLAQKRLLDWLFKHPRCMMCPKPIKKYKALTCSEYCSSKRYRWFVKPERNKAA